jgi:prefoldin subunit 5
MGMDFDEAIRILRAEKEKLDRVIASLEELEAITSNPAAPRRRGRKSKNGDASAVTSPRG